MALFSFLSRKKPAHLEVLLEIGSASVAGSLVVVIPGEMAHILYVTRRDLPFQKELDSKKLLIDTVAVTKSVSEELLQRGMPQTAGYDVERPEHIHVILSSPWYVAHLGHVSLGEGDEIEASEEVAREALDTEATRILAEYVENELPASQVALLEKRIIGMRLNGYPVTHISPQIVSSASVSTYVSIVPKSVEDAFSSAIGSVFHADISFSSFTFFSYAMLRDVCEDIAHFSVFHVNGEVTDMAIINDGELSQVSSFPLGKNFIIRALCRDTGVPPLLCQSDISLLTSNKISESEKNTVRMVVEKAKMEWASVFESSLKSISQSTPIPHITIPLLDREIKPLFIEMFSKKAIEKRGIPYLEMREVPTERIKKEVAYPTNLVPDIKMLLGALYIKRLVDKQYKN